MDGGFEFARFSEVDHPFAAERRCEMGFEGLKLDMPAFRPLNDTRIIEPPGPRLGDSRCNDARRDISARGVGDPINLSPRKNVLEAARLNDNAECASRGFRVPPAAGHDVYDIGWNRKRLLCGDAGRREGCRPEADAADEMRVVHAA